MDKGEEQDNPTLFEIMKKDPDITYNEATKVQEDLRLKKEGVCITGALKKDLSRGKEIDYHRYWKDMYEKEHKLRQEAQGETTIVKGIGMNSPEMKDAKERIKELQIRLGEALEIDEAHQKQMGKLQARLTEVEEDNTRLAHQVEDLKLNHVRKAGL